MSLNFNFTEHVLKPIISLPIQILGLATAAVPIPGLRNVAEDALQWVNPQAYEKLKKESPTSHSIFDITSKFNTFTWIIIWIIVIFLLKVVGVIEPSKNNVFF